MSTEDGNSAVTHKPSHGSTGPYAIPPKTLVVKTLPDRLRKFGGKTIVFDGTLITHRFHFAPTPHQYKHVLGWYRLISELKNSGVHAICVFDGVGRSAAKALENEKRQSARQLSVARWSMEVKRQRRLQSLNSLLKKYRVLPLDKHTTVSSKVKDVIAQFDQKPNNFVSEDLALIQEIGLQGQHVVPGSATELYEEDFERAACEDPLPSSSLGFDDAREVTWSDKPSIRDQDFLYPEQGLPPSHQYDLSEQLRALYESHRSSSSVIQAITSPLSISGSSPEEASESKNQLALTRDEDLLWSDIQSLVVEARDTQTPTLLGNLIRRSKALSDNYERRCKPPTQETYSESKTILQALGVPCIECQSPYEAEGLASSLVRRGLAHFVASEDTDVLVYGAPLLRNITSRHGAIFAISSEDVRRALRLSRAAFMDFALLIGTDFSPRLRNVGPVRALHLISTHSRIERVVKRETRFLPPDVPKYLAQVRRARRIFTTLPPVPRKESLQPGEIDKERVTELLSQYGLSRAAVDADWDPQASLAGNYFADNPIGEGRAIGVFGMHFI